jgi:lactate dehydrogenase-like 2-hydroxyacid dehydrogenase
LQASAGSVVDKAAFLDWIVQGGNYAIFDKAAGEDNYQAYKDLPRVMFAEAVAGDTHETLVHLGQKVYDNVKTYIEGST